MSYAIEDYNRRFIYITDGFRNIFVPKFRLDMEVNEPYLTLTWNIPEIGGNNRVLKLDYRDVSNYGYSSNPTSAADLQSIIEEYIDSAWTNINTGDILSAKGDLLSHNGITDTILPAGANESLLRRNNSTLTGLEWVPVSTVVPYSSSIVRKSADTTTTSTSLANIADMNFAIAANETLYFTATLKIGCSAANGARYAITVPAGATLFAYYMGMTTTAIGQGVPSWLTVSGTEGATTNALINANQIVIIKGYIINGVTAGTVNIQGRTANAANTVTYFQNSWIEIHN